jgi:hypothetical protein
MVERSGGPTIRNLVVLNLVGTSSNGFALWQGRGCFVGGSNLSPAHLLFGQLILAYIPARTAFGYRL